MSISICIPTFNRVDVLAQALQSCLAQTYPPQEILIGDDSSNQETENYIKEVIQQSQVPIKYFYNRPSLKQARNVNSLFNKVKGRFLVLLHDDDLLLPDALENLHQCFVNQPEIDVAFGKNYLMSDDGIIDKIASDKLNQMYYRTVDYEGNKLTTLERGLLQQIPNDCYMIKSNVAQSIQYKPEFADACDFAFGLQLGLNNHRMFFLNKYVACYRLSKEAISTRTGANMALAGFQLVLKTTVPTESFKYKTYVLKSMAPLAVFEAAVLKKTKIAFTIFFSKWHRNRILTLGGIKRFIYILGSVIS